MLVMAAFRGWIRQHPDDYILIENTADIERAVTEGKLGVFFDLEGGCVLADQLSMVEMYYDLGARWMLIAYNQNNSLGGGCQDEDQGLTAFGRAVLDEMARVGMVACCSHTGFRTTMDVMEYSSGARHFFTLKPPCLTGTQTQYYRRRHPRLRRHRRGGLPQRGGHFPG